MMITDLMNINNIKNKWNIVPIQVRATMVFLLATVITKGVTFLTTPIFTRLITKEDMGLVGTYKAWLGIYEVLGTLSISAPGVINVGLAKNKENREEYLSNIMGLVTSYGFFSFAIIISIYSFLAKTIKLPMRLVALISVSSITSSATSIWMLREKYEYRYKSVLIVSVVQCFLSQIVALTMIFLSKENLGEVRLFSEALITVPIGVFFMTHLLKKENFYNKKVWKRTLFFCLPLIPHYLASVVLTGADRIMIEHLDSLENAGVYTVVYGVGSIGTIVWGAVQHALTPYIYSKIEKGYDENVQNVCLYSVTAFGMVSLLISALAPEVMLVLGPKSYQKGIYVVPPLVGAVLVSCLYNLFGMIPWYYEKTNFIAYASAIAAISNVILNYIFIPKFGFVAAGYTTLLSYIILTVLYYFNMKSVIKKYNVLYVFKSWQLILIVLFFLVLSIAIILLYNYRFLRYGIVILFAFFLFFNSKEIFNILKLKR